jgi:hypothetical protein
MKGKGVSLRKQAIIFSGLAATMIVLGLAVPRIFGAGAGWLSYGLGTPKRMKAQDAADMVKTFKLTHGRLPADLGEAGVDPSLLETICYDAGAGGVFKVWIAKGFDESEIIHEGT